jgi:hypothetical protein
MQGLCTDAEDVLEVEVLLSAFDFCLHGLFVALTGRVVGASSVCPFRTGVLQSVRQHPAQGQDDPGVSSLPLRCPRGNGRQRVGFPLFALQELGGH